MKKKFSERIGIVDDVHTIQTEGMSDALRNSLWNFIHSQFESSRSAYWVTLAKRVAQLFRKVPVDEVPYNDYEARKWVKAYFYSFEWFQAYDFIEFLVLNNHRILDYPKHQQNKLESIYNGIFAMELSGYRFIESVLVPIANPTETREIANAMESASAAGLQGAHAHIHSALKLLGRKPQPDYRNSIKESISAVESIVKQISGANSSGLSGALATLETSIPIHGALKKGFLSLYGYTSNSDGIRHAILDQTNVGFDEAKYMLVSCSAFVNYLISKASEAGILRTRGDT